jgi:DNA-binding NarL/FixJ family response regulator
VIRVLVVDDHPIVREGIRQTLRDAPDITIGGEAASFEEALRLVASDAWNVVLLDLSLPGRSGFELLTELHQRWPRLPVLILSMHAERPIVLRTLRAGASGYLTKDSAPTELAAAIRRVAEGGRYVSAAIAAELVDVVREPERAPHEMLSEREFQVLVLLARGLSVGAIAERLRLARSTVSTYRTRLLEKLGCGSNAELTRYVIENQLEL